MKQYIVGCVMPSSGALIGVFGFEGDDHVHQYKQLQDMTTKRFEDLSPEEHRQLVDALRARRADEELLAAFEDGGLEMRRVFLRRKDARAIAAKLNGAEYKNFDWSVIEFGEPAERDMRPVLGWEIRVEGVRSVFNPRHDELFKTRKDARKEWKDYGLTAEMGYEIVPIYGAWRVDPTPSWKGCLRFRTKAQAEAFSAEVGYEHAEIVLHDEPVPEDQLYVP